MGLVVEPELCVVQCGEDTCHTKCTFSRYEEDDYGNYIFVDHVKKDLGEVPKGSFKEMLEGLWKTSAKEDMTVVLMAPEGRVLLSKGKLYGMIPGAMRCEDVLAIPFVVKEVGPHKFCIPEELMARKYALLGLPKHPIVALYALAELGCSAPVEVEEVYGVDSGVYEDKPAVDPIGLYVGEMEAAIKGRPPRSVFEDEFFAVGRAWLSYLGTFCPVALRGRADLMELWKVMWEADEATMRDLEKRAIADQLDMLKKTDTAFIARRLLDELHADLAYIEADVEGDALVMHISFSGARGEAVRVLEELDFTCEEGEEGEVVCDTDALEVEARVEDGHIRLEEKYDWRDLFWEAFMD